MKKLFVTGALSLSVLFTLPASAQLKINAAGATFPAPIYQQWFGEYKTKSKVEINYQAIGSGGGRKQLLEGTVDFGASDKPMSDDELNSENGKKVKPLHFPTVLGGVVITYNVTGVTGPLKLTGPVLADIYLGSIKKWNDAKIAGINAGVKLPDAPIVVVHRSDASGTSFVFTDYLAQVSADWKSKVGANDQVSWPAGLGAKGSDGVAGLVKQTPNSIGYVELLFAVQNKMAFADMQNAAGKFVIATFASVTAAAAASKGLAADFRGSIVNAPGAGSYPISTYTWMLIPSKIADPAKKKAIVEFLKWMVTEGQKEAQGLSYAPLPKGVVTLEMKQIAAIQ